MGKALISEEIPLLAVILGLPVVGYWLERRFPNISACLTCILGGLILANLRLIPFDNPMYDLVFAKAVPIAIPLLLFSVNIKDWATLAKPALISFALASVTVMVWTFLVGLSFDLGPEGWKTCGMLVATYIGGSMNLVAVGTALNASSPLLVAVSAADILWFAIYSAVGFLIPLYLKRLGWRSSTTGTDTVAPSVEEYWKPKPINLYSMTTAVGLSAVCLTIAFYLKMAFPSAIQSAAQILILTTLALALAQVPFVQKLSGNMEIGSYIMHTFFVAIGATSNLSEVVKAGPFVLGGVGVVVFGGLALHLLIGRLMGIDYETILVTDNAAIGGPTTAATFAIAMRWPQQVATGLITGLIGYATGNYLGVTVASLIKSMRPDVYNALLGWLSNLI